MTSPYPKCPKPLISVICPTYNQLPFLPAAWESWKNQICQDFELIVVNDGSNDGSTVWLANKPSLPGIYPGTVLTHPKNLGTAAAINTGTEIAEGEWWTWVSSDNKMHPEWLSTLLAHADSETGVVYSGFNYLRAQNFNQSVNPLYLYKPYDPNRLINDLNCFFGPSFIVRAGVWQPMRGRISHDWDFWSRVEETCWQRKLKILGVDKPLCDYLAHSSRVTITRKHEYDAPKWQLEAKRRRGVATGT